MVRFLPPYATLLVHFSTQTFRIIKSVSYSLMSNSCQFNGHSPEPCSVKNVDSSESGKIVVDWNRKPEPPLYNRRCIIKDMDLRPLHDRVMVKKLDEGEQRSGGIIIPDTAKEKPQQAEVMAVGSGKLLDSGKRAAIGVKTGERILFGKYSGAEIKIDGDEYLILREDEILAVLE